MEPSSAEKYLKGRIIFIDKPLMWTSFDVVNKIRKSLRQAHGIQKIKVGHTGTLDPLATGLVIICTGKATRQISRYQDFDKEYDAVIRLGATTPSFDLETEVDHTYPWEHINQTAIRETLSDFEGEINQLPPVYSAKSVQGKRAYNLARKGKIVELKPNRITIKRLEMKSYDPPHISLQVVCSKGTYIRSLARDLGVALGSGAHLTGLRRTRIGPYSVSDAITIENFIRNLKLL